MDDLKNMFHFDDCPYNCNPNGKLLDTISGELIPCPHCSKRRIDWLKGKTSDEVKVGDLDDSVDIEKNIKKFLGMDPKYLTSKFNYNMVIPEQEMIFLKPESLAVQKKYAEDLYNSLLLHEVPTTSLCFGLGIKGKVEDFIYPLLLTAYENGLSISKMITSSAYQRLLLKEDYESMSRMWDTDVMFMVISEGGTNAEIYAARHLMSNRAMNRKATIFVTTWSVEACSELLNYLNGEDRLDLAKPVFVQYTYASNQRMQEKSLYIKQLLGIEEDEKEHGNLPKYQMNGIKGEPNKSPIGVSMADL